MGIFRKKDKLINKELDEYKEKELLYVDKINDLNTMIEDFKEHFSLDNLKQSYTIEDYRRLEFSDREDMLKQIYFFYYRNPIARNIIDTFINFICGGNFIFNATDENKVIQDYIEEFWFCNKNRMNVKLREIVCRVLRDGEVFIRYLDKGDGYPIIRLIDSIDIKNIETKKDDYEEIIKYHYVSEIDSSLEDDDETSDKIRTIKKSIPAEDIQHIKIGVDGNVKRGRSVLEPALKFLKYHEDWVTGRAIINKLKSNIFLHKKVANASPSQITSLKNTQKQRQYVTTRTAYKIPRTGTMTISTDNIEYDWIAPEINAKDTAEDGRQLRLSIAAAVGIPEHILYGDSSHANYSSSLISQNPFIKKIISLQSFFGFEIQEMFSRSIQFGINKDVIPSDSFETKLNDEKTKEVMNFRNFLNKNSNKLKEEEIIEYETKILEIEKNKDNYIKVPCKTKTKVNIKWPPLLPSDEESITRALIMQWEVGIVSKETIAGRLGYTFNNEMRRIKVEKINNSDSETPLAHNNPDKDNPDKNDKQIKSKYTKKILKKHD